LVTACATPSTLGAGLVEDYEMLVEGERITVLA
jgi:hypothetical protein